MVCKFISECGVCVCDTMLEIYIYIYTHHRERRKNGHQMEIERMDAFLE